jgi:regulator of RNase E activity RraB
MWRTVALGSLGVKAGSRSALEYRRLMAALWEPELDFYLAQIGDAPVSFVLDMAAARHAPVSSHPLRAEIRIKMLRARPDGLRDASELDALGEVEDQIAERLDQRAGALYVGRFVAKGYTTLVAYAPRAAEGLLANLGQIVGSLGAYAPEWRVEEDPEWKFYFEFLYPDTYSKHFMQNRRLVEVIAGHGDKLEEPRKIDHLALFSSRQQAEQAAVQLRQSGFDVDAPELSLDDDGGAREPETWSLSFCRVDSVLQRRIDEICAEILDVVGPLDGIYDGWGAPLVRDAS